jgi:hypothetical protein
MHNSFYLHHLAADNRFSYYNSFTPHHIICEHTFSIQTDDEIRGDIIEIQQLIQPKKLIIVSHYDAKLNGEYLERRHSLIYLLERLCKELDILIINPTTVLLGYEANMILKDDLCHYTDFGHQMFINYVNRIIQTL